MAQVTGGGGKAAVMPDFDPKGTTLRDTIIGYAKASRAEGNKLVGFEDKLFKNKALQTYLDNPVVELFDGHWGNEDNPLVKLLGSVGEGSRGQLYSAFISLEENVFRQISRLRFNEEYKKLTDGVARPAKGGKYTSKFLYNPERIGDFHKGLVEFVKNNPDSKPVANALLFQLYTGFRPNAAGGITPRDIYPPESRANIHSLFIGANRVGAKGSPINVPLTRRAMAILNSQKIYNDNKFKGEKFIFQKKVKGKLEPIDDTDITGLLKKLQKANLIPPRLKVDASGDVVKGTTNLTAYDLRRIHATTLSSLGVSLEKAALLTGRVVGGGAEQARYVGSAPGSANPEGAAKNANQLTDFMYQEYSRTVPGGMNAAEKENKFLSRDRDIFSPNQPIEFVKPDTDVYKGPTYKPSANVISTADPDFIEGEFKVLDDKPPASIAETSKETQDWFKSMNIDDGSLDTTETPKIEDKTSGASKLIKGVGKKIIPSLTVAAVVSQYAKSKKAGASTLEAGVRAGTELLPLSMQDVEDLGGFVAEAREKGIPEALDLDTERQQRMNVLRKKRLADRVQRNTSVTPPEDQGFINQNQMGE
jgi:integrase